MIERQMDRPSPSPCDLVVKNGSNSRSAASAGMPLPRSTIEASRRLGVVQAALAGVAAQPDDVAGQGLASTHRRLTLGVQNQTILSSCGIHSRRSKSSRRIAQSERFSSG
jgi:hypothetical protein